MLTRSARLGLGFMALGAAAVALHSMRYLAVLTDHWPMIDPGLKSVITRFPVRALIHMLIAPIALFIGPLQFLPGLRARHPRLHRYSGRVYVAACLIAGVAGLFTALHASGGPLAGIGFATLALLWIVTTAWAWRAAVIRNIGLHRLLMRFSYAMTFGAVTLRLQIPIGFALGYPDYSAMSVWLAYTSWVPNLIVVALYSMVQAWRRPVASVLA